MKKDIHNKLIEFGSIHLKDWHVIDIVGDELKVEEFLQGQVTSDISLLSDKCSQLSSVCDHKGLVIADFIITKKNKKYKFLLNKALRDILVDELKPFSKFYAVQFKSTNEHVIGIISQKSNSKEPFLSNNFFEISVYTKNNLDEFNDSINLSQWEAANKILGNLYLKSKDTEKYRPLEINYDELRVSFDKGCYRGQEIVARMKYLGVDRRKFCTFITEKSFKLHEDIKIAGEVIELDNNRIFNGIIKRDCLSDMQNLDGIIDIY